MTARVVADGPSSRREAATILEAGGVIGLPTDTVYGIAVARTTPGGVERLFQIKRRPPDKGIVLLIDDLSQVDGLVRHTRPAEVLQGLWPGGLTLVLPAADVRPNHDHGHFVTSGAAGNPGDVLNAEC